MWQMIWQEAVAGIIVALAVLYAGAKYLPDSWRRAIVRRLSSGRQSRLASWLLRRLDTSAGCGSGSGGCNSCSSGAPSKPTPPAGKGKVIKIHERR